MQHLRERREALLAQREAEGAAELVEREAQMAEREAERERMQALEVQTQGLLASVQQLGEQQGLQIQAQLLAPPRPPPPPRRESTPVSISTIVLLSMLMLSVKPSDGRRAGFVDVSAFVPELLICRPSCRKCGCRPLCRPSSCRFWKHPHVEEVLPKFSTFLYNLDFYLVTQVQFLFFQRHSGASSNHVGGSPGSHVEASPAGASPGSHIGLSPARAPSGSQLP
jgi:hypothetical protein